jgi:hypothetical protein
METAVILFRSSVVLICDPVCGLVYHNFKHLIYLKVGCLHPVACTRSGSGFTSNATLVLIFYSVTATCFGLMTIFIRLKMVIRPKHVAIIE